MKAAIKLLLGVVLAVLCLTACNFIRPRDPLCQSWKLVSQDGEELDDTVMHGEFNYAYLRLYSNNQYTYLNLRRYAQGEWAFDKKDSLLTVYGFHDTSNLVLKLYSANGHWMKGKMTFARPAFGAIVDQPFLLKRDAYFEYNDLDLLNAANNAWRVKPDHKESKAEIRKRVIAHIDYMRKYFNMVNKDGRGSFIDGLLHSPVQFYSNGIGLKTEDNMPYQWIHAFYDEDDAKVGYHFLAQSIHSVNSYPKDKDTFTEAYYIVLSEMKDYLEMIKD